jgi:hypothetical protein
MMLSRGYSPPVCVHAHKIPLPLLANFPKKRIDVNPFLQAVNAGVPFEYIDFHALRSVSEDQPVLLFVDSYTINNLNLESIKDVDRDVYLFVGDTQHGPRGGFNKILNLIKSKVIKKVFFVNNPQHSHWFAVSNTELEKFSFLPIGMANYEALDSWEAPLLQNKIVHIGNVHHTHQYRKFILDAVSLCELPIINLRTTNYQQSNGIYKRVSGALSISLNSDLSFRLFEAGMAGARIITERIGFVQWANARYVFDNFDVITFNGIDDLARICQETLAQSSVLVNTEASKPTNWREMRLSELRDISVFARPVVDERNKYWSAPGGGSLGLLDRYLDMRDHCIYTVFPTTEIVVDSLSSLDFFLYCLDLPRLRIMVRCSMDYIDRVREIVDKFKVSENITVRVRQ